VRTAILTYIIIVAVIYHYLLAKLWNPQGWQLLADTIEHVMTPALYAIDWVRWKSAFVWLVYPLGYAVYSLIHGAVTGFYPYPFINAGELAYDKMFLNMGVLVLVFLGLGLAASIAAWAATTTTPPRPSPFSERLRRSRRSAPSARARPRRGRCGRDRW
jgi:hypothetical protein